MGDPYKILNVPYDASEEQIKEAYRELARKYHPDNYADSPLSDLANEKMQEINAAYDAVMEKFKNKQQSGYQQGGYQQSGYQQGSYSGGYQRQSNGQFSDIRRLLQQNRLAEAEELLDGTPMTSRDAEWYFLKGNIYFQRGWLDDAMNHFSTACRLNPNNPEYRAAMNRMAWQRQGGNGSPYGRYRTGGGVGGMSSCDCCANLICADCLCECCGGDLIPCC